ncbi:desulfoferrodoxin family protein [Parendozoicomonas sp. Alg238-R29]|uniref:desulfoferrodoxin family protein n=1 Tax=Parendozoicomonas sp. Alg238-R29 TaxID=2993446 RepID=UPI00248F1D89|nr:desulfoferrodoxin family protein [Parendozoicomonas sp. Alg238-R29]
MNRRFFLYAGTVATGAIVTFPSMGKTPTSHNVFGNLIFTADRPGRFAHKAKSHLPIITPVDTPQGQTIRVETNHEMNGYQHYIVKHQIFDQDYNLIDEKLFNPKIEKKPVSLFKLDDYSGLIYATSLCNKHDLWLAQATV